MEAWLVLVVVYTERLAECRAFYAGLGLGLVAERHGRGPAHFAAELGSGVVCEWYPVSERVPATGAGLRLGVVVGVGSCGLSVGRHVVVDPDGRKVDVEVVER
ncbi:glyoxalase/bleomycin resistance/dioxygenase family protein [Actinocorallia herbida]|uniref:glyoxalase/bleomycin resistance/dioxygenase family protein n=1 Tax=Actinocorallia herbida TaxID=58109 RepID=UPI001B884D24|nr:glyoxalase/bleomycin resistance/dioxygenase family protein [Actinocorallia herbida]